MSTGILCPECDVSEMLEAENDVIWCPNCNNEETKEVKNDD